MSDTCHDFERFLDEEGDASPPAERAAWEAHLEICDECRSQAEADAELSRVLSAFDAPRLAPSFSREVAQRAALARASRVMAYYWLAAGLAVVVLFGRIDWPGIPGAVWATGVIGIAVVAALPVLLLRSRGRLSLLDLIVETVVPG